MLVFGNPSAFVRQDRIVEIGQKRSWRVARLDGRGIDERLERRSRLAPRLRGAIERALIEVAAAYHRTHFTGVGVEGHERRLQRLFLGADRLAMPALFLD